MLWALIRVSRIKMAFYQQASPMSVGPVDITNRVMGIRGGNTGPPDGYLPSYLLGGNTISTNLPYAGGVSGGSHRSTDPHRSMIRNTQSLYSGERKGNVDPKPGGPPVVSLRDAISSPTDQTYIITSSSPERKQLTFSGIKSAQEVTPISPFTMTGGSGGNAAHSPNQMDPFYSQGDSLTVHDNGYHDQWVTVFGFPPAATSFIFEQFSQYGTIMRHTMTNGNWMHLQYQTKLQAKKALSKNGKVYGDGIMVGVQPCIDKSIIAQTPPTTDTSIRRTMRPLTAAYQATNSNNEVVPSNPNTPQKTTGLFSKAMEYVFGW